MKAEETRIQSGGVLRCCYQSLSLDLYGKEVNRGDEATCQYCDERFRLVGENAPIWKPLWQLPGETEEGERE